MNQIFLIITHKQPAQLAALIEQLKGSSSYFFIHVDAKRKIDDYIQQTKQYNNLYYLPKRINLTWGGFGIIKATLQLMTALRMSGIKYSHAHLLSGEDIALKSSHHIEDFFSNNTAFNYICCFRLPHKGWAKRGTDRVERYYFGQRNRNASKNKRKIYSKIDFVVNDKVVKILPGLKKRNKTGLRLYGGSSWWSFNKQTIEWTLDYLNNNRNVLRFFKTTFIPDELLFQTILMNGNINNTICNDNKRYIDWSKSKHGSPTILDIEDFETLKNSKHFFARKVDFSEGKHLYKLLPIQ